jgi:hypothetical protein
VDRRHVEVDVGGGRDQVELRDSADLDAEPRFEGELDPIRVLVELQCERLAVVDFEARALPVLGDRQREGQRHPPASLEHAVVGPDDAGADRVAVATQHGLLAADELGRVSLALGAEEREGALATAQVGHAHATQQQPILEGHRGKGDRDALDDREDVLVAQKLPEVLALLQQLHLGLAERHDVAPDVDHLLGASDIRRT